MVLLTRIELVFYPYQGHVMPLYYKSQTGVPPRTRTLTDGFGDRGAAITPEIHLILLIY